MAAPRHALVHGEGPPPGQNYVARAFAPADLPDPLGHLSRDLGPGPFVLVLLFISPEADLGAIAAGCAEAFPAIEVAGCTTAGEISGKGYESGGIVAIGFPARHFAAETCLITGLSQISPVGLADRLLRVRQGLAKDNARFPNEFGVLLVDGLSGKEDELVAALAAGAGAMPLMGGSAGDGTRFERTFVLHAGKLMQDAAVLAVLRSECILQSFCFDHLEPTNSRLVVTEADPASRLVRRLNGEPAAHEYARLLGKDPALLDRFTFAAHPLAVRMGGRHHVRSIQRILPTGELLFYSAIAEGVVLSVTRPRDQIEHLGKALSTLSASTQPAAILAFDCILRRIEVENRQLTAAASRILAEHNVTGFNTYGEQVGPLHVNQTFSGFAFYPPRRRSEGAGP